MNTTVEIVRVGHIAPRIASLIVCASLLFMFGWFGRRVLLRQYSARVKLAWACGAALSVAGILLAGLTL